MKKWGKLAAFTLAAVMLSAQVMSVSATSFTRKFNGVNAIEGSAKKPGTSTYSNGVVTMDLPDAGSLCWSYVPSATDLSFQFRIDVDTDPEFDWLGFNITSDGYNLLGGGTGLSTIVFRTGDGYVSRVVEEKVLEWDAAVIKQLHEGSLYDDTNKPPKEDYAFGYGDWVTFSMKKNGSKWELKLNGVDMVKTRYKGFDDDMTRLLGSGKITLSFFTSGVPGVVQLKSYTPPEVEDNSKPAESTQTSSNAKNPSTSSSTPASSGTSQTSSATEVNSAVSETTDNSSQEEIISNHKESSMAETDETIANLSSDSSANKGSVGLIAGIIAAVVVVAGVGVAVYFVIKKKKK